KYGRRSMRRKGCCLTRLKEIKGRILVDRRPPTTKHDYYEKTYQLIDRLFIGAGWSRVGPATSRAAITIQGQARPGKSARGSRTAAAECGEASCPVLDASGRYAATRSCA